MHWLCWLIDGSFTNEDSLSVISTLTIDDNLVMSIVIFLPCLLLRRKKQTIPEYASFFYKGALTADEDGAWQFKETIDNNDRTYSYYYDG